MIVGRKVSLFASPRHPVCKPLQLSYPQLLATKDMTSRHTEGLCDTLSDPRGSTIDLQKMNWKSRAGFQEHTGVSLKEHLPEHPVGGYTRVHQDTAESRHRQRPPH